MRCLFLLAGALVLWCSPSIAADPSPAAVSAEIGAIVARQALNMGTRVVYERTGYRPIWQGDAVVQDRARWLEAAISAAATHGLPAAFDPGAIDPAPGAPALTARATAERDIELTATFLRYATMLRHGAVDADAFGPSWGIPSEPFDVAAGLAAAVETGRLSEFASSLAPSDPQYGLLRAGLRHYREIQAAGGWPAVAAGADGDNALRHRLAAEGDLDPADLAPPVQALAAAVRRFQARHGLEPDGRIGRLTLQTLNTPVEQRIEQLAANLERWRHLPHDLGPTYVAVNVADATLSLVKEGTPDLQMRVIIGDLRHPTPVLAARLTAVTMNPPWKVPVSIATKEMLPRLKRDRFYLQKNDIAIVGDEADQYGLEINWRAIQRQGFPFRLQQRPGPNNSLGLLKLEMPNRFDVYLHDTPAKRLFSRPVRAFSHGCVRLERAIDLATRLLGEGSGWDSDALRAAIDTGETRQIPLPHPVPVYVLYWTAFVNAEGRVQFRDDLYGRDPAIIRQLGLERTVADAMRARGPGETECSGNALASG